MPRRLRPLVYACVPVLALLALGESVARLAGAGGMVLYPTQGNCQQRSALLGEEFRPHCTAVVAGAAFHTNALGLRDAELVDDGRLRILAIGDSCTFGWGVAQDDAYPQQLQARLDESTPGRYRVINAGVPGYTSQHGVRYLRERGLALRPAVVVAGYGFNDIVPGGDVRASLAWQRRIMPLLRLDDALLDHSRLWRWVRHETLRPPPPDLPLRSTPAQYGADIREIVRLAREAGAQPVLLDFLHPASPQRAHVAALHAAARELDVPLVVYDGPRLDVVHPTRDGYAWLAGELERVLAAVGALQP
ncbi:MAG TPA: GDSL-type esterase/lipase family protein [Candidatus Limnocylindria bacterium]|nr:GDSL-type esterase/lipase family protein [Candidatus Limnocylindria bacterium]